MGASTLLPGQGSWAYTWELLYVPTDKYQVRVIRRCLIDEDVVSQILLKDGTWHFFKGYDLLSPDVPVVDV